MMKPRRPTYLFLSLCALIGSFVPASAAAVAIDPTNLVTGYVSLGEWNANGNFESWSTSQVVSATVSAGSVGGSVNDESNDPQLSRSNFSGLGIDLASGDYDVIEVRMSRTGQSGRFDIFWGTTTANGISGTRRVDDNSQLPSDGSFHVIQIDMSGEADWTATLDDIRIDPFSGTATGGRSFQIDYVRVGMIVPEPSTTALLGLGGLALILRRRK